MDYLKNDLFEILSNIDVLFWFPNILNDEEKILPELKKINQKLYLIQSKFNGGRYSELQLIARVLQSKSNLLVEFNKTEDNLINSMIIGPLGNKYYDGSNLNSFITALMTRVIFLTKMTRVATISVESEVSVPSEKEFFKLVENYGDEFHKLIHAANQSRFLGNASFRNFRFRCSYGFPSFKEDNTIFVSRRNVDKRDISKKSFVPVSLEDIDDRIPSIGEKKPSVDTPIQRLLYKALPKIKYMIHAHVYIEGSPYTENKILCGSVEEFQEIMNLIEDTNKYFYSINLLGHGCIVMSNDVDKLKNLKYIKRDTLEESSSNLLLS